MGTIYTVDEVTALAAIARGRGLRVHLDGARSRTRWRRSGCAPADLTWRAGVDALTLGATKNGALSRRGDRRVRRRGAADELVYRTKRAGHVTSKMRFQSAQLIAYLGEDRWLRTAADANARMARLAAGLAALGVGFVNRPRSTCCSRRSATTPRPRWRRPGCCFYRIRPGVIRLVTSWQTTEDEVDAALAAFAAALG